MNPDWLLAIAPVAGLGAFWYTVTRSLDGGASMDVPDLQVRPGRGLSPDPKVHSKTEEEQEMTNTNDAYVRSIALEKALEWKGDADLGPLAVLETAEKFRAFLAGEYPKPEPVTVKDGRPVFRLPRQDDGYVYFRFNDSYILYRSHTANGALTQTVQRLNARKATEWASSMSVNTRQSLRDDHMYYEICAEAAALIIRKHMSGVRFE